MSSPQDELQVHDLKNVLDITPQGLYNFLQDTAIQKVVVDVRTRERHEAGYIRTALHIDIDQFTTAGVIDLPKLDQSLDTKTKNFRMRGLIFPLVFLYDDGDSALAHRLRDALAKERKNYYIYTLQGGYDLWKTEYPFLVSTPEKRALGGPYPTEVVHNFLYLGSHENAKNRQQLRDLGITHIINMAGELENEYPGEYQYLHCKMDDTEASNIAQFFDQGQTFIEQARTEAAPTSKPGKVFVHCAMGISRSSGMVISYLMRKNGWSYQQSFEFVKSMRSCIRPNPGFVKQLEHFENTLKHVDPMSPKNIAAHDAPAIAHIS